MLDESCNLHLLPYLSLNHRCFYYKTKMQVWTSDNLLNVDNVHFEQTVDEIYPAEVQF